MPAAIWVGDDACALCGNCMSFAESGIHSQDGNARLCPPGTLLPGPRRITITIPHGTYRDLQERSDREGRSLSNLSAFLLEVALQYQPMI